MAVGIWSLILSTDLVCQGILVVLLGLSIICWALALYKRMEISSKLKDVKQAKALLQHAKGMDDLLARVGMVQNTFAGELLTAFLTDFKKLLYARESGVVADKDWYLFQSSINQRVDEALTQTEASVPLLSTAAAASPLIGLFGTVWGLIHAFMAIAEQRSADIAAVAPGIAEALLTTLGGLIVAIPALCLYVYTVGRLKILEQELIDLADRSLWIMRTIAHVHPVSSSMVKPPVREQELA